jgi:hypothetical protein
MSGSNVHRHDLADEARDRRRDVTGAGAQIEHAGAPIQARRCRELLDQLGRVPRPVAGVPRGCRLEAAHLSA